MEVTSKRRYSRITKEIKNYIKRLYQEKRPYQEIKDRVEAEHNYRPSNGVIHRYGTGRKHKKTPRVLNRGDNAVDYIQQLQRKARLFDEIQAIMKGAKMKKEKSIQVEGER